MMLRIPGFPAHLLALFVAGAWAAAGQRFVADYEVFLDLGMLQKYQARLHWEPDRSLFDWGQPELPFQAATEQEMQVYLRPGDDPGRFNLTDRVAGLLLSSVHVPEGQPQLLEEPLPGIAWKLRAGEEQIGPYSCRFAEGHFRGRDYQVWYVPEIPVPYGPWKLFGLPGLVVRARDTEGVVSFRLTGLKSGSPMPVPEFSGWERLNLEGYQKVLHSRAARLLHRIRARLPRGTDLQITREKHLERFR